MICKIQTHDGEWVWVNPELYLLLKFHPSDRHPKSGYMLAPNGKELFVEVYSFRDMIQQVTNSKINVNLEKSNAP